MQVSHCGFSHCERTRRKQPQQPPPPPPPQPQPLQSSGAAHLGVDNLGVFRHVGRILDGHRGSIPFELVTDGDLLLLTDRLLHLGGLDTVRITEVKGHADQGMVLDGRVRELDRLGNNAADEAADFGRRRVGDARRNLSGVCCRWYPIIFDLHRFFIAIS